MEPFTIFAVQSLIASTLGALLVAPFCINEGNRNRWLVCSAVRFLRIGLWLPYFLLLAFPFREWNFTPGQRFAATSIFAVFTVAVATLYCILSNKVSLKREEARWLLIRTAIIQGLFISLFVNLFLGPYTWRWFDYGVSGAYAATILLFIILLISDKVLGVDFNYVSSIRSRTIMAEFDCTNSTTLYGAMCITLVFVMIWQFLAFVVNSISPVAVLTALQNLFQSRTFWQDAYVSLSEVMGGLALGCAAAIILSRVLNSYDPAAQFHMPPLHIPFLLSSYFFLWWLGEIGYWQKTLGIAMVALYPTMEAIFGLRDRVLAFRLLIAIDSALPYSVVAMLYSETIASKSGLGFAMTGTSIHNRSDGIGIALVIALFVAGCTSLLRCFAKRLGDIAPQSHEKSGTLMFWSTSL
jgi:ABC-type nitrate/sulfonate/bicarbonate transport system permease component